MNSLRLVRDAGKLFLFLALVGGYGLHQYMLFSGQNALEAWSQAVAGPNLVIGWVLLLVAVALSFAPADGDGS